MENGSAFKRADEFQVKKKKKKSRKSSGKLYCITGEGRAMEGDTRADAFGGAAGVGKLGASGLEQAALVGGGAGGVLGPTGSQVFCPHA